jgi:hypothetical protein
VEPVLAFDAGTGAVELADEESAVSRALMTAPDGRRWVVVRTGEVVDELHEIADDGTVILSLYRDAGGGASGTTRPTDGTEVVPTESVAGSRDGTGEAEYAGFQDS